MSVNICNNKTTVMGTHAKLCIFFNKVYKVETSEDNCFNTLTFGFMVWFFSMVIARSGLDGE